MDKKQIKLFAINTALEFFKRPVEEIKQLYSTHDFFEFASDIEKYFTEEDKCDDSE